MSLDIQWSEPKRVQTRQGERILRTARPDSAFWAAWKADKESVKAAGISVGKNRDGDWEICQWSTIPAAEQQERAAAIVASTATAPIAESAIEVPAPAGKQYLPYQLAGVQFAAARMSTLIADEMGLGKTIQAIGTINALALKRVLVVCPSSLRLNWRRELSAWLFDRTLKVGIVNRDSYPVGANIVVINYDVLGRHHDELRARQWDIVIYDEAHYLKNPAAARTREALGFEDRRDPRKNIKGIPARRRLYLTGTPILNRPVELWPILHAARPDLFPDFFPFAKRYCNGTKNRYGWNFQGASNLDELSRRLRESIMIRRLKADVLSELPPKRRSIVLLSENGFASIIDREQQILGAAGLSLDNPDSIAALTPSSAAFAELSRVRHELAVAKVPHVVDHCKEVLESVDKLVIFAHHRDVIAGIAAGLADFNAVTLTGEDSIQARDNAVTKFQTGNARVFIGSIAAAGVGLTLTAASNAVMAELAWNPASVNQAEDRLHRIGQRDSVSITHLLVDGSVDARMAELIVAKQEVIVAALGDNTPAPNPVAAAAPTQPENQGISFEESQERLNATAESVAAAPSAESVPAISSERKAAIMRALRLLAALDPDRARVINGVGFNKFDGEFGANLAMRESLSDRQALAAAKMLRKYVRQVPADDYALIVGRD